MVEVVFLKLKQEYKIKIFFSFSYIELAEYEKNINRNLFKYKAYR